MKTNWRGEPAHLCWVCGSANTAVIDLETRECKMCGNHYAVHEENDGMGHGIDVCACGAVVRQCRCMKHKERKVVCQTCPKCAKKEKRPLAAAHSKSLWDKTDKILNDLAWIAPEDVEMRKTKVVEQLILATSPLAKIHELMSGKEWSPDTLDAIAEVLRQSGFEIEEP